ncbi:hypothetical protein H310_10731 [Aphanomyces invadans]|uniref:Protein kintoun n=1 Tax=Aphanomyces invadans TaxID=157072 RepID=A0A024TPK8_9STRA|nr:hypothetical protein H310_10731 [Aphanomyces invadans]ETV96090.1 hypothetical protein H310_10731 [Aphanomyces invadans]|eukprot:XP_008875401.1 hypothetical protein H310_10731 [Aphanomyces invadans]
MAGDSPSSPLEAAFAAACDDPARREKFDMTEKEQQSFLKAMKDPEFRTLLNDYMQEISDPAHRAEQEMYLRQLENDNKVPTDKQLVLPKPGFVVKTKYKQRKIFVNVCSSEKMQPPSSTRVASTPSTAGGTSWNLPYCVGPQRMEPDKGGQSIATYDVCYHPRTVLQAMQSAAFMKMLINTALDGVDKVYENIDPDPSKVERDYHVLKGVSYKSGTPVTMCLTTPKPTTDPSRPKQPTRRASLEPAVVAQAKPESASPPPPTTAEPLGSSPLIQELSSTTTSSSSNPRPLPTIAYRITHRGQFDLADHIDNREAKAFRPRDLVVKMALPSHASAAGIDLDVSSTAVRVTAAGYAPLAFELPFPVVEAKGKAKFDKATKTLVVTLPVVEPSVPEHVPSEEIKTGEEPAVEQVAVPPHNDTMTEHTADRVREHGMAPSSVDHTRWVAPPPPTEHGEFVAYREFAQMAKHDKPNIVYHRARSSIHETKTHVSHLVHVADVDEASLSTVDDGTATLFRFQAGKPRVWYEYCVHHRHETDQGDPVVDWTVHVASQNVAIVCRKGAPTAEPPFRVHRVSPTVISVLVDVANVDPAAVTSSFTSHGFALAFRHDDRVKLELARSFQDAIDPDKCRVDVAQDNVLVVLAVTNPDGIYLDVESSPPRVATDEGDMAAPTTSSTSLVASTSNNSLQATAMVDEPPPQLVQVPRFSNDLMYELD